MRLVIAAAAMIAAAPALAQNAPLTLERGETLLEVVGEGAHRARPDTMTISAGVVTTGQTAGAALAANSAQANRLIEAVRALGIAPRDVRTRELQLSPRTDGRDADREDREARILGYIARNTLELRIRDLARASDLIDALVRAGANSVRGPHFSLADDSDARRLARRDAMAEARREADELAEAAGLRVARILRISERNRYSGEGPQDAIVVTGSRAAGTPIEPGEIETGVTVWVDYALVPR